MPADTKETRILIGQMTDRVENALYRIPELQNIGVRDFTPLGVLFLLASDTETSGSVENLTGVSGDKLKAACDAELQRRYKGMNRTLCISESTTELLKTAMKEAGGAINTAGPEHLILALFTMPNAKNTDAWLITSKLQITEQKVREAMNTTVAFPDTVDRLTQDATYLSTETAKRNAINILGRLNRNHKPKVLIHGEAGVGKHMLIEAIAFTIKGKELSGLPQNKMIEISGDVLAALSDKKAVEPTQTKTQKIMDALKVKVPGAVAQSPKQEHSDILYYVDVDKLTEAQKEQIEKVDINAPIIGITSDATYSTEKKDVWETVKLDPYEDKEQSEILIHHMIIESDMRGVTMDREYWSQLAKIFLQYGSVFYPSLGSPGSAIELLRYAAADLVNHGEKDLTPVKLASILSRSGKNISAESLLTENSEKVKRFLEVAHARIIGQNQAIDAVGNALSRRAAGLSNERKPIGSFVFLGPTGVGKTETAKQLASGLFGDPNNIIRIDMSEYQQEHTVSRLYGSPPGYVGYEAGGQLTEAVHKNPFSVVLFDEIDKAHPAVLDVLLPILDEGKLTDGHGKTVDFSQTVIIMTSNHGGSFIVQAIKEGEQVDEMKDAVTTWFRQQVRPEFYNRIGKIVVFEPLTPDNAKKILDLQLKSLVVDQLKEEKNIDFSIDEKAKEALLQIGFDAEMGARPLERAINDQLLDKISRMVIEGELKSGMKLTCTALNGEIQIQK